MGDSRRDWNNRVNGTSDLPGVQWVDDGGNVWKPPSLLGLWKWRVSLWFRRAWESFNGPL